MKQRLNIQADLLATQYRLRGTLNSSQNADHQRSQRVSMSITGRRITTQYDECIRYHINGFHLRQYLQCRRKRSDTVWESIDLDLFGKHYQRLSSSCQIQHMKFVHDHLPLGKHRLQISHSKDCALAACPCCAKTEETPRHPLFDVNSMVPI